MTSRTDRWDRDMLAGGLPALVEAMTDPLGHLSEPALTGTPGSHWPQPPTDDDATDAARERAVRHALTALDTLLTAATRTDGRRTADSDLRARTLLLSAVDRALSDPEAGYLRRLRRKRSALLRERLARGATHAELARELGVSTQRVRALVQNNRNYISPSRQMALDALREQGAQERAARKLEIAAKKAERAAAARAARVAEGRSLAARLAAGETREDLLDATGYSRQKIASLLAAARAATETR
ncbi:hypothetical protein KIN34_14495 [Cellulomonas sp. DKR-3]|uniref:HTH cro/C1-type domain-containing protein n=1 Tax=Cellulomonas fulva TaxID=2835530 RepID=A0ABS5U264_9CELL|nr:hypothetical protein [Cellulomonas fulva]MBT0995493.1 hypothetical protein [Cellulomonas fulva]